MDLVRFNNDMGQLVSLITAVVGDVRFLFIFLLCNIGIFALFYLALGYSLTKEGKIDEQPLYWAYFIESWKIATKGARTKISSVWSMQGIDEYAPLANGVMVLTIINELYIKIIMLSFLIAIVKTTFANQSRIEKQNSYKQRTGMNKESSNVYNQIGVMDQQDIFVLSCQFADASGPDKIDKF